MNPEEKRVNDVTNALTGRFSIGDDVIVVNPPKGWEWIEGAITKVIGVNAVTGTYTIGLKSERGGGGAGADEYLTVSPKYLKHFKLEAQ